MLAVACSDSGEGGSGSGSTTGNSGTGGSSSASGTTGGVTGSASGTGGATGSSSAGTGAGGAGPGASRATWSTVEHLICDGGAGPGGNLNDIHIVIDKEPFVCEGQCELQYAEQDSLDCAIDWRLHMRVPPAPGVYNLVNTENWLSTGPDPEYPSACQHHPLASGTVEITSVGPVEVTGVVSGVSALSAPDVDPNGPFTAPRCD